MIIGFLGKGGSGKSTLATQMVRYLHARGDTVLAIDADHNMDLAYNLGHSQEGPYLAGSLKSMYAYAKLPEASTWQDVLMREGISFSLSPLDPFTSERSYELAPNLRLMMTGPQTENVLHDISCSHGLGRSLNAYLPLLSLKSGESVIVDEKASVDAVSTGIPTGFDMAVVCVEPRSASARVGKQIADSLEWYGVPYIVALNKSRSAEDMHMVEAAFGRAAEVVVANLDDPIADIDAVACEKIIAHGSNYVGGERLARSQKKLARNQEFAAATA